MAIAVYFRPQLSSEQYDLCVRQLEENGAGHPAGRMYHACFSHGDKVAVFDVWDSQQSFERFGETLMPILKQLGVEPSPPDVMPMHNIIEG